MNPLQCLSSSYQTYILIYSLFYIKIVFLIQKITIAKNFLMKTSHLHIGAMAFIARLIKKNSQIKKLWKIYFIFKISIKPETFHLIKFSKLIGLISWPLITGKKSRPLLPRHKLPFCKPKCHKSCIELRKWLTKKQSRNFKLDEDYVVQQ